jgi:hypothetical protein
MKKVLHFLMVLLIGFGFSLIQPARAEIYEYPLMYRDARITAMGGVAVAVGGSSSAVFHNPAGLSLMQRKYGFEVRFLDLNAGYSKNVLTFTQDISDALNTEDDTLTSVNNVLQDYLGETFASELNILVLSIAKRHESISWTFGLFGRGAFSGAVHQGFGSAGLLDVKGQAFAGAFLGLASDFFQQKLHLGADIKYVYTGLVDHTFRASELVEHTDDFADYFQNELLKYGGAPTLDAGLIFTPLPDSFLNPTIGFSVMNITNLKITTDDEEVTVIPRTYNLGFAIRPKFTSHFFRDPVLGLDIIDIARSFEEDDDWGKRLHIGG